MLWLHGLEGFASDDAGGPCATARMYTARVLHNQMRQQWTSQWREWLWPRGRGYASLVPREMDQLPFPTDMEMLWIFNKHGCSACFLRRKQAGQRIARLASSIIMYQRYNRQKRNVELVKMCSASLRTITLETMWCMDKKSPIEHHFYVVEFKLSAWCRCVHHFPTRSWLSWHSLTGLSCSWICHLRYLLSSVE